MYSTTLRSSTSFHRLPATTCCCSLTCCRGCLHSISNKTARTAARQLSASTRSCGRLTALGHHTGAVPLGSAVSSSQTCTTALATPYRVPQAPPQLEQAPLDLRTARQRKPDSLADLSRAATFARLSGLCYLPEAELADALQAEGLQLVAAGHTHFTRWYVADVKMTSESKAAPTRLQCSKEAHGQRVVAMRGVAWRSGEVEILRLWQDLFRAWPMPFESSSTVPHGALTVPAGLLSMVEELLHVLCPFLSPAHGVTPKRLTFAGHSLGGSLAALLCCLVRTRLHAPAGQLNCFTFGSPPVLSLADGSGASDILKAIGLPKGTLQSFVLGNDPIPRTMLSWDLPWLRRPHSSQLAVPAPTSPAPRSRLDTGGDTFLIQWSLQEQAQVQRLTAEDMEEKLKMAFEGMWRRPLVAFQAIMDHTHSSYIAALQAAATQLSSAASTAVAVPVWPETCNEQLSQ